MALRKTQGRVNIALKMLRLFYSSNMEEGYSGDIEEEFEEIIKIHGQNKASLWLWRHALVEVPKWMVSELMKGMTMIMQYLKTAQRIMQRHKLNTLINIFGLALGVSTCLAILLFVNYELSYDKFHSNNSSISRITMSGTLAGNAYASARIPAPAAPILTQTFPEIVETVRLIPDNLNLFRYKDQAFNEPLFFFTEPSFFKIFSFPLIEGNTEEALAVPNSIVIDEDLASRLFGSEEALGKIISFNDMMDLTVTGIIQNAPRNSHLDYHMLISLSTLKEYWPFALNSREWPAAYTYIQQRDGVDQIQLLNKIRPFFKEYLNDIAAAEEGELYGNVQSLSDIHLRSHLQNEWKSPGNIRYVLTFLGVGILIMTIACLNYINITTARANVRVREIGIRKTMGASKYQVMLQLVGESLLSGLASMLVAGLLMIVFSPMLRSIMGPGYSIQSCLNSTFLFQVTGIGIFVSIFAGLLPAIQLSRYQPHQSIKGITAGIKTKSKRRMALVTFQFTVLVGLIIMTLGIVQQVSFMQNQPLGFKKEQLLAIRMINDHGDEGNTLLRFNTLKQEMLNLQHVHSATLSSHVPGTRYYEGQFAPEGESRHTVMTMETYQVGEDFLSTYQITLLQGRDFSSEFSGDTQSILINEAASEQFAWENPIGKRVTYTSHGESGEYRVAGVFHNFHSQSLHHAVKPMVLFKSSHCHYLTLYLDRKDLRNTLLQISEVWKSIESDNPFDHFFLDDQFNQFYQFESLMGSIIQCFTIVGICIGCLGLIGLIAFTTERRTKEVGIRKSIGASSSSIVMLFLEEFGVMLIVANVLAWPLGYFSLKMWLTNFAYKTEINLVIFVLASITTALVGMLTIAYWVLRAARANPVEALKYE
ncbi:ABC transporter permease [bacterium]|nr:ABC transporter permease [bacterium]